MGEHGWRGYFPCPDTGEAGRVSKAHCSCGVCNQGSSQLADRQAQWRPFVPDSKPHSMANNGGCGCSKQSRLVSDPDSKPHSMANDGGCGCSTQSHLMVSTFAALAESKSALSAAGSLVALDRVKFALAVFQTARGREPVLASLGEPIANMVEWEGADGRVNAMRILEAARRAASAMVRAGWRVVRLDVRQELDLRAASLYVSVEPDRFPAPRPDRIDVAEGLREMGPPIIPDPALRQFVLTDKAQPPKLLFEDRVAVINANGCAEFVKGCYILENAQLGISMAFQGWRQGAPSARPASPDNIVRVFAHEIYHARQAALVDGSASAGNWASPGVSPPVPPSVNDARSQKVIASVYRALTWVGEATAEYAACFALYGRESPPQRYFGDVSNVCNWSVQLGDSVGEDVYVWRELFQVVFPSPSSEGGRLGLLDQLLSVYYSLGWGGVNFYRPEQLNAPDVMRRVFPVTYRHLDQALRATHWSTLPASYAQAVAYWTTVRDTDIFDRPGVVTRGVFPLQMNDGFEEGIYQGTPGLNLVLEPMQSAFISIALEGMVQSHILLVQLVGDGRPPEDNLVLCINGATYPYNAVALVMVRQLEGPAPTIRCVVCNVSLSERRRWRLSVTGIPGCELLQRDVNLIPGISLDGPVLDIPEAVRLHPVVRWDRVPVVPLASCSDGPTLVMRRCCFVELWDDIVDADQYEAEWEHDIPQASWPWRFDENRRNPQPRETSMDEPRRFEIPIEGAPDRRRVVFYVMLYSPSHARVGTREADGTPLPGDGADNGTHADVPINLSTTVRVRVRHVGTGRIVWERTPAKVDWCGCASGELLGLPPGDAGNRLGIELLSQISALCIGARLVESDVGEDQQRILDAACRECGPAGRVQG